MNFDKQLDVFSRNLSEIRRNGGRVKIFSHFSLQALA